MLANQNILISGAGISGLTLAYWLHEWGFSPRLSGLSAAAPARDRAQAEGCPRPGRIVRPQE